MTDPWILVVAYHGEPDLRACLESLGAAAAPRTLVVDNSSSPNVRQVVAAHGSAYLDAGANLGFGAAVNLGLAHVPVDADVLLLNPDARVDADTVTVLHRSLRADERLAAVSPRLLGPDGAPERVLWPFPTPGGMWLEACGLSRLRRGGEQFAIGACLMVRADARREVGAFDERFFLYAEETDWQRRATLAGWTVAGVPEATAWHRGAGTSADRARREALFHAGTETYIRKWHGSGGWARYRAAAATGAALRSLVLRGPRRLAARQRLRLYLRGPRHALRTMPS